MLEIKDLHAKIDGKEILRGINLTINDGTVHVIMGPNGSGKSTLANVIAGHPKYVVTKGDIRYNDKSILNLNADERAHNCILMAFQYPNEIQGVVMSQFLYALFKSKHTSKTNGSTIASISSEFTKTLDKNLKIVVID